MIATLKERARNGWSQNTDLLMSSGVVVGQLAIIAAGGFLFWLIAATRHDVGSVGEAAALFSLAVFGNYLAGLGLQILIAQHGSGDSESDGAVFTWTLVLSTIASAIVALLLALFTPGSVLEEVGLPTQALLFFLAINSISTNTLVDFRQLGLRRNRSVLLRTLLWNLIRIPLLWIAPIDAATWIWVLASGSQGLAALVDLVRERRHLGPFRLRPLPAPAVELRRLAGVNLISQLAVQAPFVLLPVIVVQSVEPSENAVFFVAWSIVAVAFSVPRMLGRALLVVGSTDQELRSQVQLSLRLSMAVGAGIVLVAVPASLAIPALYGSEYSDAIGYLITMALASVPFGLTSTAVSDARVRADSWSVMAISLALAVAVLLPAQLLTDLSGATGASRAWLFGHVAASMVALALLSTRGSRGDGRRAITLFDGVAPDQWRGHTIVTIVATTFGWFVAGPIGAVVALAVSIATALNSGRLTTIVSAALIGVTAIASVIEAPLEHTSNYAQVRPIAAGTASIAVVVAFASAVMVGGETSPTTTTHTTRRLFQRPALRQSLMPAFAMGTATAFAAWQGSLPSAVVAAGDHLDAGASMAETSRQFAPFELTGPLPVALQAFAPGGASLTISLIASAAVIRGVLRARSRSRLGIGTAAAAVAVAIAVGAASLESALGAALVLMILMGTNWSASLGRLLPGLWVGSLIGSLGLIGPDLIAVGLTGAAFVLFREHTILDSRRFIGGAAVGFLIVVAPWFRWLRGVEDVGFFSSWSFGRLLTVATALGVFMTIDQVRFARRPKTG